MRGNKQMGTIARESAKKRKQETASKILNLIKELSASGRQREIVKPSGSINGSKIAQMLEIHRHTANTHLKELEEEIKRILKT